MQRYTSYRVEKRLFRDFRHGKNGRVVYTGETLDVFCVYGRRGDDGREDCLQRCDTQEEAQRWIEADKRGEHEHKTARAFFTRTGQMYVEKDGEFVPITQAR